MTDGPIRRNLARFAAVFILFALYGFTRLPELSSRERATLAAQFRFQRSVLPELGQPARNVRGVHPSFYRHASWISAVGAAVALNDLDRDGLPNDFCLVDPRSDQVLVGPVPGTGDRFPSFVLDPSPLRYDARTMAPTGCMIGDFNEDGLEDLVVPFWGRTPIAFLQRAGSALPSRAAYEAVELVSPPEIWNTSAATQTDLDGDGHVDLLFGNYFPDGARVLDDTAPGREQMQDSMSRAYNGGTKRLLRWVQATAGPRPTVRFEDIQGVFTPEVLGGWTLALATADLDGDLRPEIYFANDFGPDRLLHNLSQPGKLRFALLEGEKTLAVPSSKVLGHDSFKGMGVDFGDLNGDGLLDIYVSNIAQEFALEESHFAFLSTGQVEKMRHGIAPYVDHSEGLGLSRSFFSWEARLADFNNDGVLEAMQASGFIRGEVDRWAELQQLAMGNDQLLHDPRSWPRFRPGDDLSGQVHDPFFVRSRSGTYFDLAEDVGLGDSQVSRGIAIADVDADGRLDFATANQWETSYFFRNRSQHEGPFLGLRLALPVAGPGESAPVVHGGLLRTAEPSRPAIGATAVVYLPDGRRLTAQVDSGNGHSGDRSPELHFGLGGVAPDAVLRVDLHWRDAQGTAQNARLHLAAGWHTVLLGGAQGKKS